MSLTLRRQPLNFPHDDPDLRWSIYCDDVSIGVIVQHRGRSDEPVSWHWVMHLHAGRFQNGVRPTDGVAATREDAMIAFRAAWIIVRPAIGDEGWQLHLNHCAWSRAQEERRRRQR